MTADDAEARLDEIQTVLDTVDDPTAAIAEIVKVAGHGHCATEARQVAEIRDLLDRLDAGHLVPGGFVYQVHRTLADLAPADYRQPLREGQP